MPFVLKDKLLIGRCLCSCHRVKAETLKDIALKCSNDLPDTLAMRLSPWRIDFTSGIGHQVYTTENMLLLPKLCNCRWSPHEQKYKSQGYHVLGQEATFAIFWRLLQQDALSWLMQCYTNNPKPRTSCDDENYDRQLATPMIQAFLQALQISVSLGTCIWDPIYQGNLQLWETI